MKHRYAWGAVVLATLALSGCWAKQADLDALEAKVNMLADVQALDSILAGHRAASQEWGNKIRDLLEEAQRCIQEADCRGVDPEKPPPANSNW